MRLRPTMMTGLGYFLLGGAALYFASVGVAFCRVVRFQNALRILFPAEMSRIIPAADFCGLNKAQGLLFIWDPVVVRLSKQEPTLAALRRRATGALGFSVVVPLLGFASACLWIVVANG